MTRQVTQPCRDNNNLHFTFKVDEGASGFYAVVLLPLSDSGFDANATVKFNRTLHTLKFAQNSIKQISSCTSYDSPCHVDVPLGKTTYALVVAEKPRNYYTTYSKVTISVQCNARVYLLVIIAVVPIAILFCFCIVAIICCNMCCRPCCCDLCCPCSTNSRTKVDRLNTITPVAIDGGNNSRQITSNNTFSSRFAREPTTYINEPFKETDIDEPFKRSEIHESFKDRKTNEPLKETYIDHEPFEKKYFNEPFEEEDVDEPFMEKEFDAPFEEDFFKEKDTRF